MKESGSSQPVLRGCLSAVLTLVLALSAVAVSAIRQYPQAPSCAGMLGGGFPLLFICDDWGGGSPTGSWDKIDFIDVLNGGIKPASFLVDLLFYAALIWVTWYAVAGVFNLGQTRPGNSSWAAWIAMAYIAGLLSGLLVFRPDALNLERAIVRTPTPVMPTPTPPGTPPPATPAAYRTGPQVMFSP